MKSKYGEWALVAGSAEGLGEAYSRELASMGMNLILVDHQGKVMDQLADSLEKDHGISTRRLTLDLSENDAPDRMMEAVRNANCRLAVYNAAFSRVKLFLEHTPEELDAYIQVNTRTLIRFAHAFASGLHRENKPGGIIMMSSMGGLWGTRFIASYGATKAFTLVLAEALNQELKDLGIDVLVCIAGATATPAYLGTNPVYGFVRPAVMDPSRVAREAIRNLGKRNVWIPGMRNRMTVFLMTRLLGRRLAGKAFKRTMTRMYG